MTITESRMMLASTNVFEQSIKSTVITISGTLRPYEARELVSKATNGNIKDFDISIHNNEDEQKTRTIDELAGVVSDRNPYRQLQKVKQEIFKGFLQAFNGKGSLRNIFTKMNMQNAQENSNVITTITITQFEMYERESFTFEANGTVQTSDGRTIDFALSLSMSREFYAKVDHTNIEKIIQLTDPLVINFNADTAGLSDVKFHFDLDANGTPTQISALKSGSGFLAIDTYGDGTIRDGNQLFGTKSGNGFEDLAEYDTNGSGWIDKDDPIFEKLRVWVKDEYGNDQLFALGELGIGAIFVGSTETNFSLYDTEFLNGMISRTGIFLREDGTAGTVQHVDLRV